MNTKLPVMPNYKMTSVEEVVKVPEGYPKGAGSKEAVERFVNSHNLEYAINRAQNFYRTVKSAPVLDELKTNMNKIQANKMYKKI